MSRACVRVRPATVEDVPALVKLVVAIDLASGTFSGKPLQDAGTEHLGARLRDIVHNAERMLLVAADDAGGIAGLLAARHDDIGTIEVNRVLHVTHLVVLPRQRRRGIGRMLLAAAVNLAEQDGIEHVLATASAGSREANRYLARIGFAPLVVHRIAPTSVLRRTLGMTDPAGRMAVLRRARLARTERAGFAARAVGRGA